MRSLSSLAKKELFASQTGAVFLSVMQIAHSTISTAYLVNNTVDITYSGQLYTAYPFKFTPPGDKEEVNQKGNLTMSNIDRTLLATIRTITTPLTVSIALIMILPNGNISKEAGWWVFDLKNISYNALTISGELSYSLELGNNVSMVKYNNLTFPGLYD